MSNFNKAMFLSLCSILFTAASNAQTAFYLSNPLSALSKGRAKIECRIDDRNSLMFSGAGYWALNPGYQFSLEYRNYKFVRPATERFFYAKGGYGHCERSYDFGWGAGREYIPFNYPLFGAGGGFHFYLNKTKTFFVDLAGGLKLAIPDEQNTDPRYDVASPTFYIAGPGSVIDLNVHFGVQVGNHKLQNGQAKKHLNNTDTE